MNDRRFEALGARLLIAFLLVGFMAIIYYVYREKVSPAYAYLGFKYFDRGLAFLWLSVPLAILPLSYMPISVSRPSHVALWLIYFLVYVPCHIIPHIAREVDFFDLFQLQVSLFLGFSLLYVFSSFRPINLPKFQLSVRQYEYFLYLCLLLVAMPLFLQFGLNIRIVGIYDVYDLRGEYFERLAAEGGLSGYAIMWLSKIINPSLMCLALVYRRPIPFLVGLCGQIYVFGIAGFKGPIFVWVVILGFYICVGKTGRLFALRFVSAVVGFFLVVLAIDELFTGHMFSTLLISRSSIIPAFLTGCYYDFFSNNEKVYMSNSILRSFIEYPYGLGVPNLIGKFCAGTELVSANANIWATAYADFGFAGILGVSSILGVIFNIFDSFLRDVQLRFASLLLVTGAWALNDAGLHTALLTHGLAFFIFLSMFSPRNADG